VRRTLALLVVGVVLVGTAPAATGKPFAGAPNCPDMPADSWWHADVSRLPVLPQSSQYVSSMGAGSAFHADFGSGTWDGGPIGIPFTTVPGSQPRVPVSFRWADESDPGPYPIPADAPVEHGSDHHVLVVDRDNCILYELYNARRSGSGWAADSGARWDLRSNALRPATWTSADAAGLAILPGLARYDEVASGEIDHALRVTARATQDLFVWPATHQAGDDDSSLPPMGTRFRLKASVDPNRFTGAARVLVVAMQRYGLVLADNGSSWYVSGAPDSRWDNDLLHTLDVLHGSDFEAVDMSSLMVSPTSGQVRSPLSDAQLGRYVDAVYRDFLGRLPDAGGRAFWVGQLRANLPRSSFTNAIARSPEWAGAIVTDLYRSALERAPDAAGLDYWRRQIQGGYPVSQLAASLYGSNESYALAGGAPELFVDGLYSRILHRAPDAGGRAWWANRIRAGTPPWVLAGDLYQSPESRSSRVTGLYATLLGRAPDAGGLQYWTAALLRYDDVVLAANLAASDEYVARAQNR
jgi:hypothetical protein